MNIRYGRVFNLGNYETERIEVEDTVDEGETFEDATKRLRDQVVKEGELAAKNHFLEAPSSRRGRNK
jgi:hypothetical protein